MIKSNRGFFLPYTLFLIMLVLNIFIFVVLCSLYTNKTFNDKYNYYHLFILEERAKRHIKEKITLNEIVSYQSELIYYDEDYIYLTYQYDSLNDVWEVSFRIHHQTIDEYGTIYYYNESNKITIEIR